LVKDCFDFVEAYEAAFLAVEEGEHVQGFFFSSSAEEPFFCDEVDDFAEGERVFVLVCAGDLVLDFFAVHFGVCEIAENASEVLTVDVAGVGSIVEGERIFDFILLHNLGGTMSSESLLLRLAFLPPLGWATFFLRPRMVSSYKIIGKFESAFH
jgi:hypothetical protein